MVPLTKYILVYPLLMVSAADAVAQSVSTLPINWFMEPTDIGIINAGDSVNIVRDVSGDPDNLTLSLLLR
jgi:hypothetical protein